MIVGRRHRLQNQDLLAQQIEDQPAPVQQVRSRLRLAVPDPLNGAIDLVVDVMQPELRCLMRRLEQALFRMGELVDRLLQLEQLRNTNIAFVVGVAAAFEDGTSVG